MNPLQVKEAKQFEKKVLTLIESCDMIFKLLKTRSGSKKEIQKNKKSC